VPIVVALIPGRHPELERLAIDHTVLWFTFGISLLSAIAAGGVPAAYFSRLRSRSLAARSVVGGHYHGRHLLIAIEVALAVALLTSAALLIQTVYRLQNVDRGFSFDNVLVMQVRGRSSPPAQPSSSLVYQHFLEHIAAMSGVESAAAAAPLPFRNPPTTEFTTEDAPDQFLDLRRHVSSYQIVSPDYFRVFRIPLLEGRAFTTDDTAGRPRAVIVSEALARERWGSQSALGRHIHIGPNTMIIVGVAGDVQTGPGAPVHGRQIYVPNLQQFEPNMNIAVRLTDTSPVTERAVKMAIWSVSPNQAVFNVQPMSELIRSSVSGQRFVASLLGAFAALALFMSAAGVYTVIAYLAARRTREIAVRLAIGARLRDVVQVVSTQTFGWTIGGLTAGVGLTLVVGRVMSATVTGVTNLDPVTVVTVCAVYLTVAVVAMCVPVARILRVLDLSLSLRSE